MCPDPRASSPLASSNCPNVPKCFRTCPLPRVVALRNSAMLGACPSLAAHSCTAAITSSFVMVFSSRVFFWDGVLYWSSNNSISEIGFPDCRSQFVLSKKALPKQKSHPQRWLRFRFFVLQDVLERSHPRLPGRYFKNSRGP